MSTLACETFKIVEQYACPSHGAHLINEFGQVVTIGTLFRLPRVGNWYGDVTNS